MKKFFKKTEGFTLVELIVVIAILGILAGVGTVGYSGYIKKANIAADKQLVTVINQALAAACAETGVVPKDVTAATLEWGTGDDDDTVTGLTSVTVKNDVTATRAATALGVKAQKIVAAFDKYYQGNDNNEFKLTDSTRGLAFANGAFYHPDDVDGLAQAVQETVAVYKKSNFAGNEDALVQSMGDLSTAYIKWLGNDKNSLKEKMTAENYAEFTSKYGINADSTDAEIANATVAFVASKAAEMDANVIASALGGDNMAAGIGELVGKYDQLPTYAALYGILTGYANSEHASANFQRTYANTEINGLSDITDLLIVASSGSEAAYLQSYTQDNTKGAVADINGYLSAMQVVNAYEGSLDLTNEDLFSDPDTLALMQKVLGTAG